MKYHFSYFAATATGFMLGDIVLSNISNKITESTLLDIKAIIVKEYNADIKNHEIRNCSIIAWNAMEE